MVNSRDALNRRARRVMAALRQQKVLLVTTEFAVLEVADALCEPALRSQTIAYLNRMRRLQIAKIIPAETSLFQAGWSLYSQRPDKEWSLTDCISFVVMAQEQILEAVTSDHHFEQAGFVRLL